MIQTEELRRWISNFLFRESRWALENNGEPCYSLMVEYYEKVTPITVLNLAKQNLSLLKSLASLQSDYCNNECERYADHTDLCKEASLAIRDAASNPS